MKRLLPFLLSLIFYQANVAQNTSDETRLVIQNDKITRVVVCSNGELSTLSFRLNDYPFNFVSIEKDEPVEFKQEGVGNVQEFRVWKGPNPEEFSFLLNGENVTGKTGWKVVNVAQQKTGDVTSSQITLNGIAEENKNLELTITYLSYPNLPVIRKKIDFKNTGTTELKLESLDVESLNIPYSFRGA